MEKRLSFEREKNGKQTADGRRISTQELVLGGVFTTLIAVGAFIKIPVPVVPFTPVSYTHLTLPPKLEV